MVESEVPAADAASPSLIRGQIVNLADSYRHRAAANFPECNGATGQGESQAGASAGRFPKTSLKEAKFELIFGMNISKGTTACHFISRDGTRFCETIKNLKRFY